MPTPSDYTVSLEDIVKAERLADGSMDIQKITTKRKLELSWNYMTQSQLSAFLVQIAAVTFTVEYPDPYDGALKSGTFYAGSKSAGAIDYRSSTMRWKGIKVNFIEV